MLFKNEENIRGVFKCKYINFREELDKGMKNSIGQYVHWAVGSLISKVEGDVRYKY